RAGSIACRSGRSRGRIWKWSSERTSGPADVPAQGGHSGPPLQRQVMSNPLQQTIEALAKEKGIEPDVVISAIEEAVAVLSRKEQSRAESYTPADRVRTVIKGVNRSAKGPQIVLSRTDPALLIKLFEQEVPEIYDGTVMIRGAVREAGDRAKVAVFSRER